MRNTVAESCRHRARPRHAGTHELRRLPQFLSRERTLDAREPRVVGGDTLGRQHRHAEWSVRLPSAGDLRVLDPRVEERLNAAARAVLGHCFPVRRTRKDDAVGMPHDDQLVALVVEEEHHLRAPRQRRVAKSTDCSESDDRREECEQRERQHASLPTRAHRAFRRCACSSALRTRRLLGQ